MAHNVFLTSASLGYMVKNIANDTEQQKKKKMRKYKHHEEITLGASI